MKRCFVSSLYIYLLPHQSLKRAFSTVLGRQPQGPPENWVAVGLVLGTPKPFGLAYPSCTQLVLEIQLGTFSTLPRHVRVVAVSFPFHLLFPLLGVLPLLDWAPFFAFYLISWLCCLAKCRPVGYKTAVSRRETNFGHQSQGMMAAEDNFLQLRNLAAELLMKLNGPGCSLTPFSETNQFRAG